ncbi:MAG: hypothetical protein ACYC6M_11155 [Terriglobales bacterium]
MQRGFYAVSAGLALLILGGVLRAQAISAGPPSPSGDISIGTLARQQRAAHAHEENVPGHPVPVFTNDDLPTLSPISVIGSTPAPPAREAPAKSATAAPATADAAGDPNNPADDSEAAWRARFAKAREQLALDKRQADVAQRELNLLQEQNYADPNQALLQQHDRSDIAAKTNELNATKQRVIADQAAIASLEEQLRHKGLPPAWAR